MLIKGLLCTAVRSKFDAISSKSLSLRHISKQYSLQSASKTPDTKTLPPTKQDSPTQTEGLTNPRPKSSAFKFIITFSVVFGGALFLYQHLQNKPNLHPNGNKGTTLQAEFKKLFKLFKGELRRVESPNRREN
ncbi:unnamed protein product [Clavelina lepadiformis]|uniref:Uncharacterized protein n=1 Tax=Clavelina lepadiformis TaxID=159417 RepID=A0ABP0FMZ6_CLALP